MNYEKEFEKWWTQFKSDEFRLADSGWTEKEIAKLAWRAAIKADRQQRSEPVDWKDGYRAAMNEAGWAVRELYVNHVYHTGVDGLLKRCHELEQSFIRSAEADPQHAEQAVLQSPEVQALRRENIRFLGLIKEMADHDTYETEYDGRMYSICHGCGAQDGENHRDPDCIYVRARAAMEKI